VLLASIPGAIWLTSLTHLELLFLLGFNNERFVLLNAVGIERVRSPAMCGLKFGLPKPILRIELFSQKPKCALLRVWFRIVIFHRR